MKRVFIVTGLLALLAGPAQAIQRVPDGAAGAAVPATRLQGTIEQVHAGSGLRISGHDYVFAMSSTVISNARGERVAAPRLAAGQAVSFTVVPEGSRSRITQLWLSN